MISTYPPDVMTISAQPLKLILAFPIQTTSGPFADVVDLASFQKYCRSAPTGTPGAECEISKIIESSPCRIYYSCLSS